MIGSSLPLAVLLSVLLWLTLTRHTHLERKFAFALIVSVSYCDGIEDTHDRAVEGCRVPVSQAVFAESDSRRSYFVELYYTSQDPDQNEWRSSDAYEGTGLLQSVVQWDETTYM